MSKVFGALAILCLAMPPLLASGQEQDAPVARFQEWLDGTRDLQGKFEQTMVSGALGTGLSESGRFWLERPGRMRWDYLKPERKVALLDDGKTSLYLAEEQEIILGRLDDASELLPELLTGEGRIAERFRTTVVATPEGEGNGAYRLRLVPLGEAEPFEEVLLVLRPPQLAIEAAEVLDEAGNLMSYRFSALRRNRGLDDGLFRFDPPPGTSVLGGH
jgi:outer membrane lipoprotein carrier protein